MTDIQVYIGIAIFAIGCYGLAMVIFFTIKYWASEMDKLRKK